MTDQKTKSYYFFRKFWVFMLFLVAGLVSPMAFGFANEFHIVTNRTSWIGTIVLTAILWPLFSALFAGKLAKSVMEGWSPPKGTNPNSKNGLRRLVDTIVSTVKQLGASWHSITGKYQAWKESPRWHECMERVFDRTFGMAVVSFLFGLGLLVVGALLFGLLVVAGLILMFVGVMIYSIIGEVNDRWGIIQNERTCCKT